MDLRTVVIVSVLVAVMAFNQVCARPSVTDNWNPNRIQTRDINECDSPSTTQNETRELCQRCAKVTKSRLAYPLCCERKVNTREWCIKFLNFGQPSNYSSD